MKADTFAKLVVLDALVEAEVGHFLRDRPAPMELYRESMIARISDLIDEIDVLDSTAAGRAYDGVVDFLAALTEEDDALVEATMRFHEAITRMSNRGLDRRDLSEPSTWAIVLAEVLADLRDEYHSANPPDSGIRRREISRAEALLDRARHAADRMLWHADEADPDLAREVERLAYAIRYRRARPAVVDQMIRTVDRGAAKYRPSTITRVGAFILQQLVRRDPTAHRSPRREKRGARSGRQKGRR